MPRPLLSSLLLGVITTAVLSQIQPARAFHVVVAGETYDITAEEIAYDDPGASARFNLIADGGEMPWWGNSSLASAFAEALGDGIGPLAPDPGLNEFGPLFAFDLLVDPQSGDAFVDSLAQLIVPPANSQFNYQPFTNESLRYAFATKVVVPPISSVPGPLPILGVSVCFGYARRLRRRQRASIHTD